MENVYKLVKLAVKMESQLSPLDKLKLAKKRLMKIAVVGSPQEYTEKSFVQKDVSKESSKTKKDPDFEKRQKITDESANSLT